MLACIIENKLLITALIAIAGFLLSLFNTYRNYSIGLPRIKIKPTPLSVTIKNFSSEPDTNQFYFQFEIINNSIFPVTVKSAEVQVGGKTYEAIPLKTEDGSQKIRIEARDVESFMLTRNQEGFRSKDIESVTVSLSDDKTFRLSGRRIQKILDP